MDCPLATLTHFAWYRCFFNFVALSMASTTKRYVHEWKNVACAVSLFSFSLPLVSIYSTQNIIIKYILLSSTKLMYDWDLPDIRWNFSYPTPTTAIHIPSPSTSLHRCGVSILFFSVSLRLLKFNLHLSFIFCWSYGWQKVSRL